MKRIIISIAVMFLAASAASAQSKSSDIRFELGKGLNVGFNNGQHTFHLGGYFQGNALYESVEGKGLDDQFKFGAKRVFLTLGGSYNDDQLSFFLQMNYVDSYPLMDAWIGYRPLRCLKIYFGQKQSFLGTRSTMFYDNALALGDRSVANNIFFASGREFGLFLESRLPAGVDLGAAVTSGNGRNAFGSSSSDYSSGGLKYGGRVTLYPFGFFRPGNELTDTDFAREQTVKIAIGGAYAYNDGTSGYNGESFGEFRLYDVKGRFSYPDYRKISADMMLKYRGFTLLAEYINATGEDLEKLYSSYAITAKLRPKQIADYLALGSGYNFQAGYLTPGGWAVDARYSAVTPEWSDRQLRIQNTTAYTLGISKYFIDNRLKLQLSGTYQDQPDMDQYKRRVIGEFIAHIVF